MQVVFSGQRSHHGRHIVAAHDGEGDGFPHLRPKIVRNPHCELLLLNLPFAQVLRGQQCVVQGVGPFTGVTVKRHAAEAGTQCAFQFKNPGRSLIDIAHRNPVGHSGHARSDFTFIVVPLLNHRATGLSCARADDGHIVGAVDGHCERLVHVGAEVIGGAGHICLGDDLTLFERLRGGQGVVQAVSPHAGGGVEGDGAVGGGRRALQTPGDGGAGVYIAGAEGAAGGGGAWGGCAIVQVTCFGDGAPGGSRGIGDQRLIVAAGQSDGQVLADAGTRAIGDSETERLAAVAC